MHITGLCHLPRGSEHKQFVRVGAATICDQSGCEYRRGFFQFHFSDRSSRTIFPLTLPPQQEAAIRGPLSHHGRYAHSHSSTLPYAIVGDSLIATCQRISSQKPSQLSGGLSRNLITSSAECACPHSGQCLGLRNSCRNATTMLAKKPTHAPVSPQMTTMATVTVPRSRMPSPPASASSTSAAPLPAHASAHPARLRGDRAPPS